MTDSGQTAFTVGGAPVGTVTPAVAEQASGAAPLRKSCVRCDAPLDTMGNPIFHNGAGPFCGAACGDLQARGA